MKQEDKQYEKWLTEVKSNQPILENPEELTATILNRISGISPERKRRKFLIGRSEEHTSELQSHA